MQKERNILFDVIRGLLLVFVIMAHTSLEKISENPFRAFFYSVRMPLFLSITGYLISQKTLSLSVWGIIKKYKKRLIIPSIIAFLFYNFNWDFVRYFKSVINPYPFYHLWYIPAIFIFIFYLKFLRKIEFYKYAFYIVIGLFLCTTIYFESYSQWTIQGDIFYKILGDKRFYYFFSYFAVGLFFSKKENRASQSLFVGNTWGWVHWIVFNSNSDFSGNYKSVDAFNLYFFVDKFCCSK